MDSVDGAGRKPPVQDASQKQVKEKPEPEVSGTHKFRKVRKMAGSPTSGLKTRTRKKKPESRAFEKLRSKVKPATKATQLKASSLNAKAVSEARLFSAKELYSAAGAEQEQGKSLKKLGRLLNKYNAEVLAPDSQLSPAEKVMITLQVSGTGRGLSCQKRTGINPAL